MPPPPARRPASAASCSLRVALMSSDEPSAITMATAGLRKASSIAHNRAARSGGSMNRLRERTEVLGPES